MGGYGSMNIVLKNNRNMLSSRKKLKNTLGVYSNEKTEYNFPKASPQLLRSIKKRILEERQSKNRKIIIAYVLIMATLISLLLYLQY